MHQSQPRRRRVAAVASVSIAAVGVVPAVAFGVADPDRPQAKDPAAARRIEETGKAIDLINRAEAHVRATRRSCRSAALPEGPVVTHDAPGQEITGAIAALRRPQTEAERIPESGLLRGLEDEIYVDFIRTVTAPDGKQFVVVPGRATPPAPRPAACADAVRARLLRTTASKSRHLRSVTLRQYASIRRGDRRAAAQPRAPYDEVFLFDRTENGLGGGGGGGRLTYFLTHGNVTSSGGGATSRVTGLVPDGVASVTLTYPKRVSRGRNYRPEVFPKKVEITTAVQENVFSVRVPRGAPDAFASRTVWRGADGHVVRVVRP